MLKEYRTILEPGTDEIVEKKSRFIGYIRHTETEEEANAFINEIRKKHFDARHNCFAYSVDGQQQTIRFSDDGEPGGTAGKPILEVITGKELCDVCIVVTRYFGGTLLGTGGLVRAYTDAAKACIGATDMVTKCLVVPMRLTTNYTDFGKIQYLLGNHNIPVLDSEYGENVVVRIEVLVDDVPMIVKQLTEVTAARVQIEQEDAVYSVR
ncbi:MAG: YigZ family protein [Lachnospiraceae bacterium]|nr:YigZ family protein [Lachnospiraceae bacterium]HCJ08780.1 YigZ family protein [Lachnospiraceae bacterium]